MVRFDLVAVFTDFPLKGMLALDSFSCASRSLVLHVDVTRCMVDEQSSANILLGSLLPAKSMRKSTRNCRDILIDGDLVAWLEVTNHEFLFLSLFALL